ncbi:RAN protein kinase [Pseudohyphozyma bogoriensis]|nr:RAN protein kinase [Pseudohyphozyma bogoriensis]
MDIPPSRSLVSEGSLKCIRQQKVYERHLHFVDRECSALKKLVGKPHVIQHQFSNTDPSKGLLYLVTDYYDYGLFDILKCTETAGKPGNPRSLPPAFLQHTFWRILTGLDAIHQAGFVHRDLKPENVFFQYDNREGFYVSIGDFGLVGAIGEKEELVGTLEYMPPEAYTAGDVLAPMWMLTLSEPGHGAMAFLRKLMSFDPRLRGTVTTVKSMKYFDSYHEIQQLLVGRTLTTQQKSTYKGSWSGSTASVPAEYVAKHGYPYIEIIGAGGFSKVYKLTPSNGQPPSVLKVFNVAAPPTAPYPLPPGASLQHLQAHQQMLSYYDHQVALYHHSLHLIARECSALKKLAGKRHVIQHQFSNTDPSRGNLYLITDYYDFDLFDLLKSIETVKSQQGEYRPLSPLFLQRTFWRVLTGLGAIHRAGFVHRDLKPENLFFRYETPGGFYVAIGDFGVVGTVGDMDDSRPGTLEFVPPEAYAATAPTAPSWDLWGLGATWLLAAVAGASIGMAWLAPKDDNVDLSSVWKPKLERLFGPGSRNILRDMTRDQWRAIPEPERWVVPWEKRELYGPDAMAFVRKLMSVSPRSRGSVRSLKAMKYFEGFTPYMSTHFRSLGRFTAKPRGSARHHVLVSKGH